MDEWAGKTVLVTGAAGGMGKAVATRFLQNGATVIASDINASSLEKTAAEFSASGGNALAVVGDVSKVSDCKRIVSAATNECGRLDSVINCAGVWVKALRMQ